MFQIYFAFLFFLQGRHAHARSQRPDAKGAARRAHVARCAHARVVPILFGRGKVVDVVGDRRKLCLSRVRLRYLRILTASCCRPLG